MNRSVDEMRQSIARLARQFHRWLAVAFIAPLLLTSVTGVMLILRNDLNWISPPALKLERPESWASVEDVYSALRRNRNTGVKAWSDIGSIIARPGKGTFQVRTKDGMLVQLHGRSAKILDISPRRVGFLIRLHEGSYWGRPTVLMIFLPSALGLIILLVTGGILIYRHYRRFFKYR